MQFYTGTDFFICLILFSVPAVVLGILEKSIRYYGMAVSVVILWLILGKTPLALVYMGAFIIYEYVLARIELSITKTRAVYWLFLILGIAPLAAYKFLCAAGNPHGVLAFVGISYMSFKAVQILIEIYDGTIKEVCLFDYLYLMLFFPTISSGPIDRSRRFSEDLSRKIPRGEYLEMVADGIYKILLGVVYKTVISAILFTVMSKFGSGQNLKGLLFYMYAYGFYLFFDFAGYSLMAIGTGYLFGIRVPENFNKPFLSRNISDFWNRWHITLSHWLRDYCFSRITMDLMRSGKIKSMEKIAGVSFMINMLIMGCWHGLTSYYIAYGLYHGILLTVHNLIRSKSSTYKKLCKKRGFIAAEWLLTVHLVLFGFLIFSGRLNTGIISVSP